MAGEERQRIDKWLFFARVVKSRSLAAKLVQAGRVRVNREKAEQAAHPVKPGDVLTIKLDRRVIVLPRCRAPACAAGRSRRQRRSTRTCRRSRRRTRRRCPTRCRRCREAGSGRPTKKERREMQKFRDGD